MCYEIYFFVLFNYVYENLCEGYQMEKKGYFEVFKFDILYKVFKIICSNIEIL